jgi:SagB-type dehydrogenase family enzyme
LQAENRSDAAGGGLPKPVMSGGKPLMEVLKNRRSERAFSAKKIEAQALSNLLWAAFGVNRAEDGKRTAPSAFNAREIEIYVATPEGLFLFDPEEHNLKTILKEDVREKMGGQANLKKAPVRLVYVADLSKLTKAKNEEDQLFYAAADTGYISQNVYLFCASEGLGTVVHAMAENEALASTMKLRPDQRIILAQSVGYAESAGD